VPAGNGQNAPAARRASEPVGCGASDQTSRLDRVLRAGLGESDVFGNNKSYYDFAQKWEAGVVDLKEEDFGYKQPNNSESKPTVTAKFPSLFTKAVVDLSKWEKSKGMALHVDLYDADKLVLGAKLEWVSGARSINDKPYAVFDVSLTLQKADIPVDMTGPLVKILAAAVMFVARNTTFQDTWGQKWNDP
jgi:hypothetical protein